MDELPDYPRTREGVAKLAVDFPRLVPDSPKGCPASIKEIRRYVSDEWKLPEFDLAFGRSANVAGVRFWVWTFKHDEKLVFVDVSERHGVAKLAASLADGLTIEQFVAFQFAQSWRDRLLRSRR